MFYIYLGVSRFILHVKEDHLMPKARTKAAASSALRSAEFLSVEEAAELLRMSQVSIRRYLGQGKLKRFKVGSRTLVRHDDVMALVREA